MKTIQTTQILANSKFNKFHLLIFIWCFYSITFDGYDMALYGISLPLLMEDYGITEVQAGSIGSYAVVGTMIGTFIFGSLSDVIGRKRAIAICLLLFSVFTFLCGFAPNADLFLIFRVIACMGLGGIMPILVAAMAEYAPLKKRALTVALMYCGYSIGGILASLIGMFLMEELGWRILYWIAILPFLTLPFFLKQFPDSVAYHLQRKQGDKIANILNKVDPTRNYQAADKYDYDSFKDTTKKLPVKKIFTEKRLVSTLAFWVAVGCSILIIFGITTWLPKIMVESGYGLASSLSFNLVLSLGQITGSILGGMFVARIGHRKVLVVMLLTGAVSFVFLSLSSNIVLLYVLIAIAGACTVGAQNLINPYISEFYPREIRATGLSIAVGVGRIGGVLAPIAVALLLTTNLAPQHAFMFFAIPSLLGAISFMIVQEKYASFDKVTTLKRTA